MTHKDLAQLQQNIYSNTGQWTQLYEETSQNPIHWAYLDTPTYRIVVFRGSQVLCDFAHDAEAMLVPTAYGLLDRGFYTGMADVMVTVLGLKPLPLVLTGHSLGAARACNASAMATKAGATVVARVTWGEPRVGLALREEYFATPHTYTYRMHAGFMEVDPVTLVPPTFGHPAQTIVNLDCGHEFMMNPLALHAMKQYAELTPDTELVV